MRTIKFRVKYQNWIYYFGIDHAALLKAFDQKNICQFTGLKDIHGKEIYEGDIIRSKYLFGEIADGIVKYDEEKACFAVFFVCKNGKFSSYSELFNVDYPEIVGTVFDGTDRSWKFWEIYHEEKP